ncbi:MAG: 50S ribosomal protein L1 [Nitrospinae bacterium]|nr:50S ribosomal protein L1 [Nitrospinota bacterium]
MGKLGKKLKNAYSQMNKETLYPVEESVSLLKKLAPAKFDESVDVAVNLGVDPRKADQNVRGTVMLPQGTGKTVRILVFAKGEKEAEAKEAGADYVGADELAEKIQGGWLDFDKVIATPDMMGLVGKLGKVLGPRGLMPNPKTNTVTFDVKKAIESLKGGMVDFRVDKTGIVHSLIGKASFKEEDLLENYKAFIDSVIRLKPSSSKGKYIRKITISSTMGPGIVCELPK